MKEKTPRLKKMDKYHAPYPLGEFPADFPVRFGREIVYLLATRSPMGIEGKDWEKIFADCIGAEWHPSNVGLDDVRLEQTAWSAKTVYNANPFTVRHVRLITGRNSPDYSYDLQNVHRETPNELGKLILGIWNERISDIRRKFSVTRTVVLIKSEDFTTFSIFEEYALRFLPENYYWEWNANGNLAGYDRETDNKRFTWQPHGSQFTVIANVPDNRLKIRIRKPDPIDKDGILKTVRFDPSWVEVVR